MGDSITPTLKDQGKAVLVMVGVAIASVLGMVIIQAFQTSLDATTYCAAGVECTLNATIIATVAAFIAGFALVGTFATITMLVIVVKAIIGVVRGLK